MPRQPSARRPAYLRVRNVALVFAGGVLGVLAREALILAVPDVAGMSMAVLLANVVGAFLLGLLLESLGGAGGAAPKRVSVRLFFGTGVLGGFTTYSALAQSVSLLWLEGEAWTGLAYGLGTVLLGALATLAAVAVGALAAGKQHPGRGEA